MRARSTPSVERVTRTLRLELSLQRAAAEVAHNVALRRGAADGGASAQANRRKLLQSRAQPAFDSAALERFSHGDRQQAIEIWLAMDGVLDSLYDQPQDDASKRKKAESKDADSASAPSR